jgi:methyl-accepting chemotaxis protein
MNAALMLKRSTRLEQALMMIALYGAVLVMLDLARTGLDLDAHVGGLMLAGSGLLFWWRGLRLKPAKQPSGLQQADAAVLAPLAQLDEELLAQLARAVSLSEASSMNTVGRVQDLHQLSGQLIDYLQTARQQSVQMQQASDLNGSIATEFTAFVQQLPQQIAQEREHLEQLVADVSKLSTISETIRGMARQTEILSINAAIAAAHAGDAGRAFSVLAGEVRRLALESSTSAQSIEQNIRQLVETVQARKAGEFAQRMQHNEREVARLLTLTSKFDEGFLDMRQFYAMLLTAITEHNTKLSEGIVSLLEAGQYHDVFKQIVDRQEPALRQRHAVLDDLLAEVRTDKPDMDTLATRAQGLLDQYIQTENAHRPPASQPTSATGSTSPERIELF